MERKLLFVLLSAIVVVSAFLVTQELVTTFPPGASVEEETAPFSGSAKSLVNRLEDAYSIVKNNFYDPDRIGEYEAISAGIRGMIQYIRDPEAFDIRYVEALTSEGLAAVQEASSSRENQQVSWEEIFAKIADLNMMELEELKSQLDKTYSELYASNESVDHDLLNDSAIVDAGIRTMVGELEDPYSRYNTLEEYMAFTTDLNGEEYEGIGAFIELRDGYITISSPIKGGPAEEAGVRAGDKILTINGESTRGFQTPDATRRLRGDKGTDVTIEVERTTGQIEEITITRDRIKVPSVSSKLLEPEIGMVSINRFGNSTTDEVKDALRELERQASEQNSELEGLIVDLRNNGGGYLRTAREIASLFVDGGNTVVIQKERDTEFSFSSTDNTRENLPIAVLINRGTASASEILAGAIRDNDMGILIGEDSFGKGVIQTPLRVGYDSRLILTTAEYLTPDGHPVQEVGLSPAPGYEVPSWFDTYLKIEVELSHLAANVLEETEEESAEASLTESDVAERAKERSASEQAIVILGDKLAEVARTAYRDEYQVALIQLKELRNFLHSDPEEILSETEKELAEGELERFSEGYSQFLSEMEALLQEVETRLVENEIKVAVSWLRSPKIAGTLCPCEIASEAVSSGENSDSN